MDKKKRNLIVFDIDGTLTDTVDIHQNAFKKSLQLIGVERFDDAFGTYKHHTDSYIAKVIFEYNTHKPFDKSTLDLFEAHLYMQIYQHKIIEISGAKQMIKDIESKTNFGICFATGSLLKPAILKLDKAGIDFDPMQIVASNEMEEREEIIIKAINNARSFYQVEKFDRIISFGDGIWDLRAAQNLSLEFVGIGNKHKETLTENGMEKHYQDFVDLNWEELIR
jgi:beta-phosphoglucomutase-like phosphatase (HAD superfamily)